MFKKLDKLILKAFFGPFVATFFITLLVLIMQFFWLYIDEFVGKGLDAGLVFEFIWYQSAVLIPLALPLSILLSSLMTFGNLSESFELVAIKAAGISLLRFMRPLFILTLFICMLAFLFSNHIIPVATLKSRTLLTDIVHTKPAFDLKEGVFYDKMSGISIKIGKKEENDSIVRDIIIYEQSNPIQDNFIIAQSGIMKVSDNKRYLEFNLKNGWRYEERAASQYSDNSEYVRMGFKEYKKLFDISALGFGMRTADSLNKNNERMLSIRQLNKAIDSIQKDNKIFRKQVDKSVSEQVPFEKLLADSVWKKPDSIDKRKAKNFNQLIPDSAKSTVMRLALQSITTLRSTVQANALTVEERDKALRRHKIEWHKKIVLTMSCLVLFMIGAPLGSIIRKGGLGTPLIFAIIFFMLFYFSSTIGEKFVREDKLSAFVGMWLPCFILVPIGLFLIYKAMQDSQLFNKEFYYRFTKNLRKMIGSKKKLTQNPD